MDLRLCQISQLNLCRKTFLLNQPDGSNKILFFPQRPRWVQNSFQKDFALFTHARFVTNLKDQLEFKGARGS